MSATPQGGLYLVDCDAAHQYAHAVGIWQDLAYSADLFARLYAAVETEPRDNVIERGLWTAAVVFYARCFRKGRRYSLSLTIFDGRYPAPAGALEEHEFLMDIAQKDLGRSISIFEQSLARKSVDQTVTGLRAFRSKGFRLAAEFESYCPSHRSSRFAFTGSRRAFGPTLGASSTGR